MSMHVGHVAVRVPDLDASVRHAQDTLGLRLTASNQRTALLTANAKHHELQLLAADRAGLDHIGLELADEHALEAVRDRLVAGGIEILSERTQEPGIAAAIRCLGPADVVFELYTSMARAPLALDNLIAPIARKLGHVTLFSEEKDALEEFVLTTLGFRVSDRWGDRVTWMRCDSDHHGIAVGRTGTGTRLHHYAFQLAGWDSVGRYADHIARSGQQFLWGPGRHGPGLNIFTYLPDPAGVVVEAYTDLLRIEHEATYHAIDWSAQAHAMNLWGPLAPADWDELGVPVSRPARTPGRRLS